MFLIDSNALTFKNKFSPHQSISDINSFDCNILLQFHEYL